MQRTQVYDFVNKASMEALGLESSALLEDLSNIVEIGRQIDNANAYDAYVKSMTNLIGKMDFNDRVYEGELLSIMRDAWEYGSIKARVSAEMPEASENESWELNNHEVYSNEMFYQPTVSVEYYNKGTTFEVDLSFTTRQIKQSLRSAVEAEAFVSMLETSVKNTMTIKTDALIKRAINNMIAMTVHDDFGASAIASKSGVKAVNLLYLYNDNFDKSLTAGEAIMDADFIKYAVLVMKNYADRIRTANNLFNISGKTRFTPASRLHWILHSEFKNGADVYLQSETFHNEFVKLPSAESIAFWQNVGRDFSFTSTSEIKVTDSENDTVNVTGIIGVMFDTYAVAVSNLDNRVTSAYNAKAEFYNNFYKADMELINCRDENFVVFFVA